MSTSLYINCRRSDEPAATDPLERRTWAALRIVVEGRCATQYWDRSAMGEAEVVYVPTFPIARWIVDNWWPLFLEPCRSESPPAETQRWRPEQRDWVHRHCLRSAEPGLFLPYLHIFSHGPGVSVAWFSDDSEAYPSMPGYFLYAGLAQIRTPEAMDCLGEFVSKVLDWCQDLNDERVDQLRADWAAINETTPGAQLFCRAAGRLGLDPYAVDGWNPGLVDLVANEFAERVDDAFMDDLLEAAVPASAGETWRWLREIEDSLDLRAGSVSTLSGAMRFRRPVDQGYFVARRVRLLSGLAIDEPITDLTSVARRVEGTALTFEARNHIPAPAVDAAVGWCNGAAVIAGPEKNRPDSQRFLLSRGLYQALVGCQAGPRLVTRAHTWDQQASRAFAAELLAPQAALALRAQPDMEPDERRELQEELAAQYQVSTEVVRLQLQNEGVWQESSA